MSVAIQLLCRCRCAPLWFVTTSR